MLPILKPHDLVEIIAPASRCSEKVLQDLKNLLESWSLNCLISEALFGDDILCANSDAKRLASLKNALTHPESKAIICVRGGYGSMRLIPGLYDLKPPKEPKIFLGMSDITALHLFLENHWNWPSVHGALARDKFSEESILATQSLLFGKPSRALMGKPLNQFAEKEYKVESTITGGNLTLVQSSLGTKWQINGQNKVVFLEEVGERGYRIDRMLEHLKQA
ncbi:MAG: LD-carboxypeptidase, partial [Legionella sp.]